MSKCNFGVLSILLCVSTVSANPNDCGKIERGNDGFHEGQPYPTWTYTSDAGKAIIIKQDMRVNADGARTAYEINDHGSSYLCDGLTAFHEGKWITSKPCGELVSKAIEKATIKNDYLHFASEGPQLCIFGFHVEGGKTKVSGCSHVTVGGGHEGAKAPLVSIRTANNSNLQYFVSSTSLRNRGGDVTERYIDSEKIPFIVIPGRWQYEQVFLRDYAYVYSPKKFIINEVLNEPRGSFAIVADTGPKGKFGEGSIALHQMLAFGKFLRPPPYQKVGKNDKHPNQAMIYHPYQDTDGGDIRAKSNIDDKLWYILFPGSGDKSINKHTFMENSENVSNGNVQLQGEKAANQMGGIDNIISCLKESDYFKLSNSMP